MKKIYDHREFTWGLVGIALAAVCGGIMVLRGSSLKLAVIMVFGLVMLFSASYTLPSPQNGRCTGLRCLTSGTGR